MIDQLVRYLKERQIPFRLCSYSMPEPLPEVAHPVPHLGQLIETHVVLAGGVPGIVCVPAGERVDLFALGREIGSAVLDGTGADLPGDFRGATNAPPFGALLGVPLFMDSGITGAVLVFRAFAGQDFLEIALEDFTRLERPRVAAFAIAGALPPHDDGRGASYSA